MTIRYFQKRLKIAIFTLWSLRFKPNHENAREGKALKEKPLPSLETVAIFVFLIQQCFTGNKLDPDPFILKALNKFRVSLPAYISSFFKSKWYIRAISRSALKIPRDLFKVLFFFCFFIHKEDLQNLNSSVFCMELVSPLISHLLEVLAAVYFYTTAIQDTPLTNECGGKMSLINAIYT